MINGVDVGFLTTCVHWVIAEKRDCCTGRQAYPQTEWVPVCAGGGGESQTELFSHRKQVWQSAQKHNGRPAVQAFGISKVVRWKERTELVKCCTCPTTPLPLTVSSVPERLNILQCLSLSCTRSPLKFSRRILYLQSRDIIDEYCTYNHEISLTNIVPTTTRYLPSYSIEQQTHKIPWVHMEVSSEVIT